MQCHAQSRTNGWGELITGDAGVAGLKLKGFGVLRITNTIFLGSMYDVGIGYLKQTPR